MSAGTLLLGTLVTTATALLYLYVGNVTLRRTASDAPGRLALRLFALWWFGLAALSLIGVVEIGLAAASGGTVDAATHRAFGVVGILPLVAILFGLVSYLSYIYTGSRKVFLPSALFHLGVLGYFVYLIATTPAQAVVLGDWGLEPVVETEPSATVTAIALSVILLPALAAAIGYASLYFRTKDRSARYRIAMVSGAFVFWFGSVGIAGLTPLADLASWPLISRMIALISTLMVLAAYRPPGWMRERYGLRSTDENVDAPSVPPTWRTARATLVRLGARRGRGPTGAA